MYEWKFLLQTICDKFGFRFSSRLQVWHTFNAERQTSGLGDVNKLYKQISPNSTFTTSGTCIARNNVTRPDERKYTMTFKTTYMFSGPDYLYEL